MKPKLLVVFPLEEIYLDAYAEDFQVLYAPSEGLRRQCLDTHGESIFAVLTTGNTGLEISDLDAMPALEVICAFGAGYENVPVAQAKSRGIVVTHSPGANDDSVADHAMALLFALVRDVAGADRATRRGLWRDDLPLRPALSGKKLGLVGLGNIGSKIAQRAASGFGMSIGYHARRERSDSAYGYFASLRLLAQWADFLILAAPGGEATRHIIGEPELRALGPQGYLVNVGRGSLIDTQALAAALRADGLAGVALDVYESEPEPPRELFAFDRVLLTPHVAGSSPEAMWGCVDRSLQNMKEMRRRGEPVTPVA